MMTPQVFMSYATPVIILIAQQLHNWQSRKQADETVAKIAEARKAAAEAAEEAARGKAETDVKLESVHVLVNGNLTALQEENARLRAEIEAHKAGRA